jgi:hypothetical protein
VPGDNVLDQISHFVMKPEMAPAALALSTAGVDFSAWKYRLSAAREGWISFLEMLPPRGVEEWFSFLLSEVLPAPVCAWLESRAPLADEELSHAACCAGDALKRRSAVMKVIVKRFKTGEATESTWCPFLEGVAMKGRFQSELEIQAWIATGCNVNWRGDDQMTFLMRTAEDVYEDKIKILGGLIKGGADVDLQMPSGKTALMYAAERRSCDAVEVLITAGANLNVPMNDGQTALSIALEKSVPRMVWQLFNAGADPLTAFRDLEAIATWKRLHPQSR